MASHSEYLQKMGSKLAHQYTTQCTSPVSSMVLRCKLVSGWGLKMEISPALWAMWLGKDLLYLYYKQQLNWAIIILKKIQIHTETCLFLLDICFPWEWWILIIQCKFVFVIAQWQISPHGSKQESLLFTTILDFAAMISILMIMKIRIGFHLLVLVQNFRFIRGQTGIMYFLLYYV